MAEEKDRQIPIEWHYPEQTVSRYATNLIIQKAEHEYILSFFELLPPVILGETDIKLESIPAECVGRIIVSEGKFPEFVAVLQTHLQKVTEQKASKLSQEEQE